MTTGFKLHNRRDALIFLAPTLLTYGFLFYIPFVAGFFVAFFEYDILSPPKFVGWKNFIWFFANPANSRVPTILWNTLKYLLLFVPCHFVIGMALALLVHSLKSRAATFMRILYYLPCILTTVSTVIAWRYMFHYEFGIFNYILSLLNIPPIKWLVGPRIPYISITIFSLWRVGGTFLFFYIGLGNIPEDLYEAARIDGANRYRQFRSITLPLLSPILFFAFLSMCIGVAQIFEEPFLFTSGGPGDATRPINMFIYEVAFVEFNLGRGAVPSLFMSAVLISFALFQFRIAKRWVYYGS